MRAQRHSEGNNGARPGHGALTHCEYGLLTLERPAGNLASARPQGSRDNPEDTMGTGDTDRMETWKGECKRQHAPPPECG